MAVSDTEIQRIRSLSLKLSSSYANKNAFNLFTENQGIQRNNDAYIYLTDNTATVGLGSSLGVGNPTYENSFVGSLSNHDFVIRTNNLERIIFKSNGSIETNNTIKTPGIIFTNGNVTLDDYEEGDFYPAFGGSTSNGSGLSYSFTRGRYCLIGNTAIISGHLQITGWTSKPTGFLRIAGLPFTAKSGAALPIYNAYFSYYGFIGPGGRGPYTGIINPGENFISVYYDYGIAVPCTDLDNVGQSRAAFTLIYEI